MRAEVFLDTNVLVYAFDPANPRKQQQARDLIRESGWWISWQVVQEFAHVALHRFAVPLKGKDLADYLEVALWPRCRVFPSPEIFRQALRWHGETGHRIYDCLILASAMACGAKILLSEDFQDGRSYGSVKVLNPFREA
jgi:predicted nucleic acid-binding protein